jgi:hypothetical protein
MSDPALYIGTAVRAIVEKATLPKNLAKDDYVGWAQSECLARLNEEIRELRLAILKLPETGDPDEILKEAADVIAFAAMLQYTDDTC